MGLSASQARMLSLTSRLSDLEFQAQQISNAKLRLADSSAEASEKYMDALDKQKLTVADSDTQTYVDASAYNLTTFGAVSQLDKQRILADASGRVLVTSKTQEAYEKGSQMKSYIKNTLNFANLESFLSANGITTDQTNQNYNANLVNYYTNIYNGTESFLNSMGYTSATEDIQNSAYYQDGLDGSTGNDNYTYDSAAAVYYDKLFNEIQKNGYYAPGDKSMKDPQWLYQQLSSGNIYLYTDEDKNNIFDNVSWSSGDASLKQADDDMEVAKAEAEYETTMAQIEAKDSRFDMELKEIDTEHNAIQTEMDSVSKIISKNIERSFKIFDA